MIQHGGVVENHTERRKTVRRRVDWNVTIMTDHGEIEGTTRDVSPDGISIVCEQPLYLGEICWIAIYPASHPKMEVTAKVVWSDLYGIEEGGAVVAIGVCFVQISRSDRRFFTDVISTEMKEDPL